MKYTFNSIATLGLFLLVASHSFAAPITYNFSVGGFANDGTITGSFTGEDLNGDGYLSSFIFSQAIDFNGTSFQPGLSENEVTFASLEFNGEFDTGGTSSPITYYTDFHDLTDTSDVLFPGFPLDLFFVLNFELNSDYLLGNNPLEGILIGRPSFAPLVFGLGQFLPIPQGQDFTDAINELPGGASVTSGLILNNSNGMPCIGGAACGVLHSVVLDSNGAPTFGAFDLTSGIIDVQKVPAPSMLTLFAALFAAGLTIRLKNSTYS